MAQKLAYIHTNPVVAGFVDREEAWLYSSAKDYCGGKGLLDILFIDWKTKHKRRRLRQVGGIAVWEVVKKYLLPNSAWPR